jgi:hypothetical protein
MQLCMSALLPIASLPRAVDASLHAPLTPQLRSEHVPLRWAAGMHAGMHNERVCDASRGSMA